MNCGKSPFGFAGFIIGSSSELSSELSELLELLELLDELCRELSEELSDDPEDDKDPEEILNISATFCINAAQRNKKMAGFVGFIVKEM